MLLQTINESYDNSLKAINLPYKNLSPSISRSTIDIHYHEHHKGYLEKLKKLIKDTDFESKDLDSIIKSSSGNIFNNAAQVWNHNFYWQSLKPNNNQASDKMLDIINNSFDNLDNFKEQFIQAGLDQFASGWLWLIHEDGKLKIKTTSNANTPIKNNQNPILVVDLWEHAYYIDYKNDREEYLNSIISILNWKFAESSLPA